MLRRFFLVPFIFVVALQAEDFDDVLDGFDEEVVPVVKETKKPSVWSDLSGKLSQQTTYSYGDTNPHDNFSSLKTSLFLDYEHKFDNGFKFKSNLNAYYDAIYSLRGKEKYTHDERKEFESEAEVFDAYFQGSLTESLDIKIGRQVVVWGRSDTIRITDVLNPLDNRRPGMVDIEDLRLPVGMLKFDYYIGAWRITPLAVFEQRFSKNPPSGSSFNPSVTSLAEDEKYNDILPALSIGAAFENFDLNFYAASIRDDSGYLKNTKLHHDKVTMLGSALNVLHGSWLLKAEAAHFDGLKYTTTPNKEFQRTDTLVGVEYNGFADTLISYDASLRKIHGYDTRLKTLPSVLEEKTYQHAFRMSSDFINATLQANYLISLYGSHLEKGGFQRAWVKYDMQDNIYMNLGVVDYIGGSQRFDLISKNDTLFLDINFGF